MLKKFLENFKHLENQGKNSKFLLAISGGVDSMVLADLFLKNKLSFAVAHCNFGLRGMESDGDETYVKAFFEAQKKPVFSIKFETMAFAQKNKIGIQEAARKLRYDFFNNIIENNDYQYIVTAHHANDNVETMLINLSSSTGLRGIKGISKQKNQYFRPLLSVSKQAILAYAKIHHIAFREDSSNSSQKYTRNAIRQNVIPELEKINPNFIKNAAATLSLLDSQLNIYNFFINFIEKKIISEENNTIKINIETLLQFPETSTILYEFLSKYGFVNTQTMEMSRALETRHSGKMWFSQSHEIILDRKSFIVRKKIEDNDFQLLIHYKNNELKFKNLFVKTELLNNFSNPLPNELYIDVTKCDFPIILRKWKAGDYFLPLGLEGKKKKIQDFLTDAKLNRFEKDEVLVLENKGQIMWVVGFRPDIRFAATSNCTNILKISTLREI